MNKGFIKVKNNSFFYGKAKIELNFSNFLLRIDFALGMKTCVRSVSGLGANDWTNFRASATFPFRSQQNYSGFSKSESLGSDSEIRESSSLSSEMLFFLITLRGRCSSDFFENSAPTFAGEEKRS